MKSSCSLNNQKIEAWQSLKKRPQYEPAKGMDQQAVCTDREGIQRLAGMDAE